MTNTAGHTERSLGYLVAAAASRSVPVKVKLVGQGNVAFALFRNREDATEVLGRTGCIQKWDRAVPANDGLDKSAIQRKTPRLRKKRC